MGIGLCDYELALFQQPVELWHIERIVVIGLHAHTQNGEKIPW